MLKNKRKYLILIVLSCLCLCFTGCTKTIELGEGVYRASDIVVNQNLKIDNIELSVDKVSQTEDSSNVITINGEKAKISIVFSLNGKLENITDFSVTYYGKKMRATFKVEGREIFLSAGMKQKNNDSYMDASIKIDSGSIDFRLTK